MALDVGTLVGHLDLDDSKYQRKLGSASKGIAGFAGTMGKVVLGGAAVASVAVAGFAAKGLKEFGAFEKGMNEVYTLLPGISEKAMGDLSDDTRKFVREMGVAHEEAVPALYSALSAGVPKENVFEFMEVSAKASKAGVTDLNSAVDGISSVVNAYGDSLSGAGEASDLMFTAVRLGKTTFEELSASLFQVNPTAAALGVGFEDVTASLAVMTAQGVPTSVATTQLRQAMVELSKDGGKTADTFKEISGKTFKEFIAEGGSTGEALQMLADHASDTGLGVNDLFGSVEAGNAALALTGENSAKFDSALAEMQASAGATDAAFETMDRGLERSWEKIRIGAADAAVGLGEKLAPAVADLADWFLEKLPGAVEATSAAITTVVDWVGTNLPVAIDTGREKIRGVMDWFDRWGGTIGTVATVIGLILLPAFVRMGVVAVIEAAKVAGAWIMTQAGAIKAGAVYIVQSGLIVARWVAMSTAAVLSGAKTAAVWTGSIIASAVRGAASFAVSVARVVGGWVLMGVQSLIHAGRMAAAWFIALGPIGWITAAVIGIAALVIANWDKISAFTAKIWSAISGWITKTWDDIKRNVSTAAEWVRSWVVQKALALQAKWNAVWAAVGAYLAQKWAEIKSAVGAAIEWVRVTLHAGVERIKSAWSAAWNWIKSVMSGIWEGIKTVVRTTIDWIQARVRDGMDFVKRAWSNAWGVVKNVLTTIWDGIKTVISNAWDGVKRTLQRMVDWVTTKPGEAFDAAKDAIGTAWDKIKAKVKTPIVAVIGFINDGLIDKFNGIPGVNIPRIPDPKGWRKGGYTGDGNPNDVAGVVHKKELVLPEHVTSLLSDDERHTLVTKGPHALAHAATVGQGNIGGFFTGSAAQIRRHGAYNLDVAPGMGPWNFRGAARMWDGAAGVRVKVGRGPHQGYARPMERGGGILGYATGTNIDMSPSWMGRLSAVQRRTVAAHEMGHAMGLPHNSMKSIMQPNLGNMSSVPTPLDIRNMQALYPGGSGKAGSGEAESPSSFFGAVIDFIAGKIKTAFPDAGMFVDVVSGIVKSGVDQVIKWATDMKDTISRVAGNVVDGIKDFFGGGGAVMGPKLMDGGGWLRDTDGPTVIHRKKKPDAFTPYDEWQQMKRDYAERGAAGMPSTVVLRVGDRDFVAYLEDLSVNASGGAMSRELARLDQGGKYVMR